jgi:hypothetical protein
MFTVSNMCNDVDYMRPHAQVEAHLVPNCRNVILRQIHTSKRFAAPLTANCFQSLHCAVIDVERCFWHHNCTAIVSLQQNIYRASLYVMLDIVSIAECGLKQCLYSCQGKQTMETFASSNHNTAQG